MVPYSEYAMDENKVRNLVKGWHQRSRAEGDPTSKFVFLWFCFNAWLAFESEEDTDRVNRSAMHIDFMIGGADVDVTGVTRDGARVPLLLGGVWQI